MQDMKSTDRQASLLTPVLAYASRGWRVFPCHSIVNGRCTCPEWRTCNSPGKHPHTTNGFKEATTDPAQLRRHWMRWPHANIGIATGKESNLVVLDIDPRHGGEEGLSQLEMRNELLPGTVEVITGSNGKHLYFTYPSAQEVPSSAGKLAPGVDVRGEGGYVIAPPSAHLSGHSYEWELSHHPDETALAPLPAWIITLDQTAKPSQPFTTPEEIREGSRNDTLFRLGCSLRAKGLSETAIRAALLAENQVRCVPPLADAEVEVIVKHVGKYEQGNSQDTTAHIKIEPFIVNPKASPDAELWAGLLEIDDRFKRTWEHRRKDLKTQAFEVYEYSLARQTRAAEWTTQEIVNLLIFHRRKYAAPLQDEQYYRKVLQKTSIESDKTDEEGLAEAETKEALAEGADAILTLMREKLDVPITQVIKRGKQKALYSFLLEDGEEIAIGPIENLASARVVRLKIAEVTRKLIRSFTDDQWRKIFNLMDPITIEVDVGGERKEQTREWISHYLDKAERTPFPLALVDSDPFIEDGHIYLNVMSLRVYLNRNWMQSIDDKAIRSLLSELGFLQKKKSGRIKGKVYTRNYWYTTQHFLGESNEQEDM